jgi:hypothetical protein
LTYILANPTVNHHRRPSLLLEARAHLEDPPLVYSVISNCHHIDTTAKIQTPCAADCFGYDVEHNYRTTNNPGYPPQVEASNLNSQPRVMPLTYHFRPFPAPEELRSEPKPQPTTTEPSTKTCPCQKAVARCKQCRQKERQERSSSNRSSQTILPSIKEEADPLQRALTPRAIREQRRAANRVSVSAALHEAVGSEDYFTFYHDTAFARSPPASSRSRYRSSRTGSDSRKPNAEEASLPSIPTLEASDSSDSVESIDSVLEGEQDLARRDG